MKKIKIIVILFSFIILNCNEPEEHNSAPKLNINASITELSLFGEHIIPTVLYERDMAISSSGDELIYTLGDFKQNKRCLVSLKKDNGIWSEASILGISEKYQDI